jgi:quercetin 2,3-dioxygenase
MQREISKIYSNNPVIDDGQMLLYRLLPMYAVESVGPFVFVDYYAASGGRGIGQGPHPHAGIEVLSYLLKGHVEHRDSQGFIDRICDGEAQHIKAGRGIIHAETPLAPARQGLQLWLSLPPDHLFDEPTYASFKATTIPQIQLGSASVKVIVGTFNEFKGPVRTVNESLLWHIHLKDSKVVTLEVNDNMELAVIVLNGQACIAGKTVSQGDLALLSQGSQIMIESNEESFPVDLAIFGGTKINYSLVFHGPFVMDSEENILRAYEDYRNGKMGVLN